MVYQMMSQATESYMQREHISEESEMCSSSSHFLFPLVKHISFGLQTVHMAPPVDFSLYILKHQL